MLPRLSSPTAWTNIPSGSVDKRAPAFHPSLSVSSSRSLQPSSSTQWHCLRISPPPLLLSPRLPPLCPRRPSHRSRWRGCRRDCHTRSQPRLLGQVLLRRRPLRVSQACVSVARCDFVRSRCDLCPALPPHMYMYVHAQAPAAPRGSQPGCVRR